MDEMYSNEWGTTVKKESVWYAPTKEWGGSLFFMILVLIYIGMSFFLNIENAVVSLLVTQGMIVIPAFIYMLCLKVNPFRFIRFRKFHLGSAFLVVLFMICLLPVMWLLNAISMLFSTNTIQDAATQITGGNVWTGLLLMAVLPAFVEECTFRGAIYHSLRGARPIRAIILSGLMFGAMHMNFNQFVYAAGLGIIMAFLLEATGSILSTMIVHFCFNSFSVVLMCALPYIYKNLLGMSQTQYESALSQSTFVATGQSLMSIAVLLPIAAIGGALAVLLYYAIAKLNNRWYYICFLFSKKTKEQRKTFPKPRLIFVTTIVAFVMTFAMCVLSELYARGVIHF